jgi:hypothetical protein
MPRCPSTQSATRNAIWRELHKQLQPRPTRKPVRLRLVTCARAADDAEREERSEQQADRALGGGGDNVPSHMFELTIFTRDGHMQVREYQTLDAAWAAAASLRPSISQSYLLSVVLAVHTFPGATIAGERNDHHHRARARTPQHRRARRAAKTAAGPMVGSTCPVGFEVSAGMCIPTPGGRCAAFIKPEGVCPVGYGRSGPYCLQTGCDSH